MGGSATDPIDVAPGTDLGSGRLNLTVDGGPFAAITFANKANPSVVLADGSVVTVPAPIPVVDPVVEPAVIVISTPKTEAAPPIIASAPAVEEYASPLVVQDVDAGASPSVASAVATTAATVSPGGNLPSSPVPTVGKGPVARRLIAARRRAGQQQQQQQQAHAHRAIPVAARRTAHAHPKGPLGHRTVVKPVRPAAHHGRMAGKRP